MKKLIVLGAVVLLFAFTGCSSVSVTSDYDPSADFTKYKTYQWKDGKKINPGDILQDAAIVRKRIQAAVDDELAKKGFQKIEEGEPDMFVLIHAGVKEKMNVTDWGYGYGRWYGPYGPHGRNIDIDYYSEGTIFIDIVDNEVDELVWRGAGTSIVKHYDSPEERETAVKEYIAEIMKNFPPQK